jgi:hypothetical protein
MMYGNAGFVQRETGMKLWKNNSLLVRLNGKSIATIGYAPIIPVFRCMYNEVLSIQMSSLEVTWICVG